MTARIRLPHLLTILVPILLAGCSARPEASFSVSDAPLPSLSVAAESHILRDFDWFDAARQRPVPARLYLPAQAESAPLIVFSHGLGGSRFGYSYLGRYWASQGFASLHVQHQGSDRAVWTAGGLNVVASLRAAASEENALARAGDVRFAITAALSEPNLAGRLDPERIAVAGHSYGANTAMLVGGATVERAGRPFTLRDPRVKALILISAPPIVGEGELEPILAPITIPSLHLTGTEDLIRVPGYYSEAKDRVELFRAFPGERKALAVFRGGTHAIFTDRFDRAGPELNLQVKVATRLLTTAFLRATLAAGADKGSIDQALQAVVRESSPGLFSQFETPALKRADTSRMQRSSGNAEES